MAKVGTAYVEIKPDISGFARELRDKLAKVKVKYKVDIDPDLTGFGKEVKADLAERKMPTFKLKAEPDLAGCGALVGAKLTLVDRPVVKLRVEPADPSRVARVAKLSIGEATKRASKK